MIRSLRAAIRRGLRPRTIVRVETRRGGASRSSCLRPRCIRSLACIRRASVIYGRLGESRELLCERICGHLSARGADLVRGDDALLERDHRAPAGRGAERAPGWRRAAAPFAQRRLELLRSCGVHSLYDLHGRSGPARRTRNALACRARDNAARSTAIPRVRPPVYWHGHAAQRALRPPREPTRGLLAPRVPGGPRAPSARGRAVDHVLRSPETEAALGGDRSAAAATDATRRIMPMHDHAYADAVPNVQLTCFPVAQCSRCCLRRRERPRGARDKRAHDRRASSTENPYACALEVSDSHTRRPRA